MPSSMHRLPAAALVVAIVLSLPLGLVPVAAAQSAGDDQYADPLGGGGGDQGGQAPEPQGGDTPTSSDDPAPPAGSDDPVALPPGAEPAADAAPSTTLPRTGAATAPLALVGLALLACGIALRRLPAAASRRP
jgi:hypothetical protein